MALFSTLATQAYVSWERSSELQQAISETMAVLRRAKGAARFLGQPYQIEFDAAARVLTGSRWELESGRATAKYVAEMTVSLPRNVFVKDPTVTKTWVVDIGEGLYDDQGQSAASEDLSIRYGILVAGAERTRTLSLKASGVLTVESP